ncbi:MAG TPA: phosphoglucomutase/phosphomannomutase family protein [Bacteroidota bacterium]|nr:phosphoglucomutase/phosphomannomutase family protein [Bacteroidota bacterium]
MAAPKIKFGTDGWRGVIAADFTFDNIAKVALATATFYKKHKKIKNGIVVGYDSRFLSREFAEKVSEVLGNRGIKVILSDKISSTPMVSLLTKKFNAAAGIIITASHNPAKYNGFKIKGDFGGPAFPEAVAKVEKELAKIIKKDVLLKKSFDQLVEKEIIKIIDFTSIYIDDIKSKINIDLIKSAGIKIAYDAMHGAGQGVMDQILPLNASIRGDFNPSFGGHHPEPLPQHTAELIEVIKKSGSDIGIATDGDADRIGAFDEQGNFVDSHRVFALLLKYFIEQKHMTGEVAKSFSVSQVINKMCKKYNLVLHETPVGFKYLCQLMIERDILIAAEESGGLGVKGHLPERDGTYIGLLLCEIMATRKKKLSELVEEIMNEYGWFFYNRYDAHLTEKEKNRIMATYKKGVKQIAGFPVQRVETKDGFKLFLENGWVLVRASGTEPLIRFYAEAETPEKVEALLKAARSM